MATTRCEPPPRGRRAAIAALYAGAVAIVAAGLAFGVYAVIHAVNFTAMGMDIPGVVFAAVAVFLGVRYFRSVQKMSRTLRGSAQAFNWNNFKPSPKKKKDGGFKDEKVR